MDRRVHWVGRICGSQQFFLEGRQIIETKWIVTCTSCKKLAKVSQVLKQSTPYNLLTFSLNQSNVVFFYINVTYSQAASIFHWLKLVYLKSIQISTPPKTYLLCTQTKFKIINFILIIRIYHINICLYTK